MTFAFHGMENSPVMMLTATKEFAVQFSLDPLSSFLVASNLPHRPWFLPRSSNELGYVLTPKKGKWRPTDNRGNLEKRIEITNDGWRLRIEHVRSLALISFAETANDGNPIDKEEVFVNDESRLRLEGLGPGRAFRDWVGWIIELGAKVCPLGLGMDDWPALMKNDKRKTSPIASLTGVGFRSGPGFESNRPSSHLRVEARNSSKCSFFNLSAAQEVGLAAPPTGVDSSGRAEQSLAVGRCSLLGRVQTGLKGGGIQ
ncbi:hypothetical protein E3N88_20508 [Mikania micrantha]|uniref:Uncharacterized protein n=1 Tax=Mikania micrantha TaxID=192012 RepID=A0A5N6NJT0_9ASTR|nr:hypothetical protein E3N88_20508 [Mikania micrantha]